MNNLEKIINEMAMNALEAAAAVAVDAIVEVTPRDLKRPPKLINRKDGARPKRKRGVTSFGGNYYPQVTGNLKKSIGWERDGKLRVKVGTEANGPTSRYARTHEFWLPKKNIPPRPYVSRPYTDASVHKDILNTFEQACKIFLSRK